MKKNILILLSTFVMLYTSILATNQNTMQERLVKPYINTPIGDNETTNLAKGGLIYNGTFYLYITPHYPKIYKSYDGVAWEEVDDDILDYVRTIIWDGKRFVAGHERGFSTSIDGVKWEYKRFPDIDKNTEFTLNDLVYANNMYCVVGSRAPKNQRMYLANGYGYYSKDLEKFSPMQMNSLERTFDGALRPLDDLIYNGKAILGVGNTTAISKDGKVWDGSIAKDKMFDWGEVGLIWDGKQFIDSNGKRSKDGVNWTKANPNIKGQAIAFNGRTYLVIGDYNEKCVTYYYSKDGIKWIKKTILEPNTSVTQVIGTKDGFILAGNKIFYIKDNVAPKDAGYKKDSALSQPKNYGTVAANLGESIKKISVSDKGISTILGLSDKNNLFEWGWDVNGLFIQEPRKVLTNVKRAKASNQYCWAITNANELYLWGDNSHRQIAECNDKVITYPVKVMDNIEDVAVLEDIIYFVTKDHVLYSKSFGQDKEKIYKVMENVKSVHTGTIEKEGQNQATVALTTLDDQLFMWGWTQENENLLDNINPVKVMDNVKQIDIEGVGFETNILALTNDGDVYEWEKGIDVPWNFGKIKVNKKILSNIKYIENGYFNRGNMAITKNGDLLTWGEELYATSNGGTSTRYKEPTKILSKVSDVSRSIYMTTVVLEKGEVITNETMFSRNGQTKDELYEKEWFVMKDFRHRK